MVLESKGDKRDIGHITHRMSRRGHHHHHVPYRLALATMLLHNP